MPRPFAILVCAFLVGCPTKSGPAKAVPPARPAKPAKPAKTRVVKMHRPGEKPEPEPKLEPRPPRGPHQPSDVAPITVRCDFDKGFVSILPAAVYDPGEPYLMQALIGLKTDTKFWITFEKYKKLHRYQAQRCDRHGATKWLAPGKYVVAVGRAGQFSVRGKYKDNGFVRHIEVEPDKEQVIDVRVRNLRHTWNCISCPYLVVFREGEAVDVGQVLVDRYTRRRHGTDVVRTKADVKDGVLVIRIEEREPETSFVKSIVVRAGGRKLRPVRRAPTIELKMGEAAEVAFDASRFADGPLEVEIAVSGHYEPIGPLL